MTVRELQERTGQSEGKILVRLRQLNREGKLEAVKVSRKRIDGGYAPVPAYRLKQGGSHV